jgi:hypothetical protein
MEEIQVGYKRKNIREIPGVYEIRKCKNRTKHARKILTLLDAGQSCDNSRSADTHGTHGTLRNRDVEYAAEPIIFPFRNNLCFMLGTEQRS